MNTWRIIRPTFTSTFSTWPVFVDVTTVPTIMMCVQICLRVILYSLQFRESLISNYFLYCQRWFSLGSQGFNFLVPAKGLRYALAKQNFLLYGLVAPFNIYFLKD